MQGTYKLHMSIYVKLATLRLTKLPKYLLKGHGLAHNIKRKTEETFFKKKGNVIISELESRMNN